MVFSSLLFLFRFLPAVLIAYYAASVYIFLMLASILSAYIGGIMIEILIKTGRAKSAEAVLIISCLLNLSMLAVFKYADFAINTLNKILRLNIPALRLALPIGISFYTFQTLSYVINVYRSQAGAQKNFISFGAYISMFPQLITGPIVRYCEIDRNSREI